jgi:hypothetical protein
MKKHEERNVWREKRKRKRRRKRRGRTSSFSCIADEAMPNDNYTIRNVAHIYIKIF